MFRGCLFVLVGCFAIVEVAGAESQPWTKHVVTKGRHCNTAVAIDANQDGLMDVIAAIDGQVKLFLAPQWTQVNSLHFLARGGNCIHSTTLDVDADGDLDWAGSLAAGRPFWLENPGPETAMQTPWQPRIIDPEITGIHCLMRTDVDNNGRDDLVINNFEPDSGIKDSMAWYSVPDDPKSDSTWNRHVFADGDARGGSHYLGAGDIDGDGYKEIAVGAKGKPFADGNWFAFWQNPGPNDVRKPWKKTLLAIDQPGATNILPADVNGDGALDWVATRGHGHGVLWFENPGWAIHPIDPQLEFPHSLTVADFDLDGDIDAASCGYGSERVMWYENDGRGKFTPHVIDRGQQSYDLNAVDMDGDGDLDLLNAGRATGNVVWYENPGKRSAVLRR
ncbi:VCBS repeat-containing protein [Roseiconus nitratireducens]|uniref:VCBS repeat-containing protein n=2 Tax=Roseiconus nitratireducens TaxID=2605748 RepID=A0A5M6D7Q0_9BACT|nr:VCBS repeat-containing protein [Roseiconus nitratireducens]